MDVTLICTLFEGLPRQGPGLDESTVRACSCIPSSFKAGKILDIGCGSGMQTLALAKYFPDSEVTASDIHQPFLDELRKRAKKAGLDQRIVTRQASMDHLPFEEKSFDIIWAEGSAFVMGLSNALSYWKKFLIPDGFLVFSDCTWFTDSPSEECREFFAAACPDMPSESGTRDLVRSAGFTVIDSFRLPDAGWWRHYYTPLTERIPLLKDHYATNPDAMDIIQGLEHEIEIYRKYSKEYGYCFFINKNSE
ncbi:MAG: methyltransferase domain-containing protein [Methanoregulaceae archaeon]|nr:methyltransferase domain-containing protein [Methanoregulaceae archaeon]